MTATSTLLASLPSWLAPARAAAWLYGLALLLLLGSLGITAVSHVRNILDPIGRPSRRLFWLDITKAAALLAMAALAVQVTRRLGCWNSAVWDDSPRASAVSSFSILVPILAMAAGELFCRTPLARRSCGSAGFACMLAAVVARANCDCLAITSIRTHSLDGNFAPLAALGPAAIAYAAVSALIGLAVCSKVNLKAVSGVASGTVKELPIVGVWLGALLACVWTVLAWGPLRTAVYDPVAELPSANALVNGMAAKTAVVGFCAAAGLVAGWLVRSHVPGCFPNLVRTYLASMGAASALCLAIGMYWLSAPSARLANEYGKIASTIGPRPYRKLLEPPPDTITSSGSPFTKCGYCHAASGPSSVANHTAGLSHAQLIKLFGDLRSADELASRYRGWMPPLDASDVELEQAANTMAGNGVP